MSQNSSAIDVNALVASFQQQIADQALAIAERDSRLSIIAAELAEVRQQVDELAVAVNKEDSNGTDS